MDPELRLLVIGMEKEALTRGKCFMSWAGLGDLNGSGYGMEGAR